MQTIKALYGFDPDRVPGISADEQAQHLRDWGLTAVFGGYDDDAFAEAAHAAGMQVYAEFNCFTGQQWWEQFPESRPVTAQGEALEPTGWYYGANPSLPALRENRLAALEKLLRDHAGAVDGVWLDFVRWPCRWEGAAPTCPETSFDPGTLERFQADTHREFASVDDLLQQHHAAWIEWKCEQVRSFVAAVRALVDRVRPGLMLGLFGVPWRRDDHDGAILRIIGQDFADLAPYIDVFSPMTYHAMCHQPPEWVARVAAEYADLTQKPVCPIVQSVDHPGPLTPDDYAAGLQSALHAPGTQGAIVFTLAGVVENEAKLARTRDLFRD